MIAFAVAPIRTIVFVVAVLFMSGCTAVIPLIPTNETPVVLSIEGLHSPNGEEQHAPYEWDIFANGYDPDGEIVQWVLRINGDTFRVVSDQGNKHASETIRYQFPGPGDYPASVTVFDDDGASSNMSLVWHVDR